ncbi:hypothetical protein GGI26_002514 [Coemansia sp. RSA 1358]|nr:hypothetical protein GGI26_002514 [Coemansia sp. RSA 1358]
MTECNTLEVDIVLLYESALGVFSAVDYLTLHLTPRVLPRYLTNARAGLFTRKDVRGTGVAISTYAARLGPFLVSDTGLECKGTYYDAIDKCNFSDHKVLIIVLAA